MTTLTDPKTVEQKVTVPATEAQPYKKLMRRIEVAPMQFQKDHMQRQANKIVQRICGNGAVTLSEGGEAFNPAGVACPYYVISVDKTKCQNQRRHGSKFCQACSDAHTVTSAAIIN